MKAKTVTPREPFFQPRPLEAARHVKAGNIYVSEGNYHEAIKLFDKAIKCDPSYLEAYYVKGTVQNALKHHQEAIATFNILISKDLGHTLTHKAISKQGVAWAGLENYDEALRAQDASLAMKPTVAAYCHKATLLYHAGKDAEALECFNFAHRLESSVLSPLSHTIRHGSKVITTTQIEIEKTLLAREALRQKFLELQETTRNTQQAVGLLPEDDTPIPSAVCEAVAKFKSLVSKSKAVTQKVVSALDQPKGPSANDDKVRALEKQIAEMQHQMTGLVSTLQEAGVYEIPQIRQTLHDAGIYEIAKIKQDFDALEHESLLYCTTFYWNVINLIGAYRHISTEVIAGDPYGGTSTRETLLVSGAKKAASIATDFAKGIPFVGCIVSALDTIVNMVYESYKKQQLAHKVDAINSIVQSKFLSEEDVSKTIAKMALNMTQEQKAVILGTDPNPPSHNWLIQKIMDLLTAEDTSKPFSIRLALKDVALFMAHLFAEHEQIVESPLSFDLQIPSIIHSIKGTVILLPTKADATDLDDTISEGISSDGSRVESPQSGLAQTITGSEGASTVTSAVVEVLPQVVSELAGQIAIEPKVCCSSCWCW